MNDKYNQFTEQDHADLCVWLDDIEPVYDDEGVRCECEDYPCCGH